MPCYFKGEIVPQERWIWEAIYTDGSQLKQFDSEAFHQFKEIDQNKLLCFRMVSGEKVYSLLFKPEQKLIHFYRNIITKNGNKERFIRIYCFGYQEKDHKVIMAIMPNDELILTDDIERLKIDD